MSRVKAFIFYSTILGLFATAFFFYVGNFAIQYFYLLMVFNLCLMLVMRRVWVPLSIFMLLAYLAFSGASGIFRGTDNVEHFAKQFAGIGLSAAYFTSFFRFMDFNLERCFVFYARVAYWVSIIGLFLLPFRWLFTTGEYRLRSVLSEPAMYALTCLPAFYYFADNWQRKRKNRREVIVFAIAFIFAGSSLGFFGIFFGLIVFSRRYRRMFVVFPLVVMILGFGLFQVSKDFRIRVQDTVQSFLFSDVTEANLSTFALYTNMYVTKQVVRVHPILGNGLGSHGISYLQYAGTLSGVELWNGTANEGLNAEDGDSLFLRITSELGLVGIFALGWFLWKFRPIGNSDLEYMSRSIWIYFFVKLLRSGVYFSNEQLFFFCFYALANAAVYRKNREEKLKAARAESLSSVLLESA